MKVFWSKHFVGVSWVFISTNFDPRLKNIAVQQILHSNECASLSINFVHLDNKYNNTTNREFIQWATWQTRTPEIYWYYLAWCNLLLGLRRRIALCMFMYVLCGKKSKRFRLNISNGSSDFKWILNVKLGNVENSKENGGKFTLPSWIEAIA